MGYRLAGGCLVEGGTEQPFGLVRLPRGVQHGGDFAHYLHFAGHTEEKRKSKLTRNSLIYRKFRIKCGMRRKEKIVERQSFFVCSV